MLYFNDLKSLGFKDKTKQKERMEMEKVLKTQNSRDNSTRYSLIESEVQFDGEKALTYGIRIEGTISGEEEESEILDITTSYEKAEILFRLIVCSEITPVTLKDVTEDFLNA